MIPPYDGPQVNQQVNIELGNSDSYQLYNLKNDIGQTNNLAEQEHEKLKELLMEFVSIRGDEFRTIEQLELK